MARLTILMATYNGGLFLREQLQSFKMQTFQDWDLLVSDDGSTDNTIEILKDFAEEVKGSHQVSIINGPRMGYARNFLYLITHNSTLSEYYALSDQDDVWNIDKLERAVQWLSTNSDPLIPSLYCSRTEIVDRNLKSADPILFSPLFKVKPTFSNALVQCLAGGNTMVFNQSTKNLVKDFGHNLDVPSHDWWLYILVTGVGGEVYYDPVATLKYRQHGTNLVGENRSCFAIFRRLIKFLGGQFKAYNERNIEFLFKNKEKLSQNSFNILKRFDLARKTSGIDAVRYLISSGVKRNGFLFNIALKVGAFFSRI